MPTVTMVTTPSSSVRSWDECEQSSVGSHESVRDSNRTLYMHDPYSFACFTVIGDDTPKHQTDHQSEDHLTIDASATTPVPSDEVQQPSAEDLGALVIADMGKLGTLMVAKRLLKDETGRARTPCGHTKRQRLRHKGHIAYFTCCECATKYREIGPQKVRDDQLQFLLNGGQPTFV